MNQTITREKLACLELSLIEEISRGQAAKWSRRIGSPALIFENLGKIKTTELIPEIKAEAQRALDERALLWRCGRMSEKALQVIRSCNEKNIDWISLEESMYPEWLRQIADPPVVLYVRGDLKLLHKPCVSVVGSRKAGAYGQKAAYEIAAEAAKSGFTVVSGMAMGVDACAHKGALDALGATAAVMPCGLDLCYPKCNTWLYHRICQNGVAISEYPPGCKAEKWHFVERNRLVSGLSLATVIAQAGPKSGSIRTAQLAAEQGREVFGVPGDIFDLEYLGVHNLIQDGANVLTSPKGLTRALTGQAEIRMHSERKLGHAVTFEAKRKSLEINMIDEEALRKDKEENRRKKAGESLWLYEKIDEFGCLPEKLCELTGCGAQKVQQAITLLEMQGLIKRDANQRIIKA